MRIFLDANILVSGMIFKGKEHELLTKNKNILFITSEDALDETKAAITQKLHEYTTVRDRNDRHILAAAIIEKADYIVTGDADLLNLKTYNNIPIVQARKLLSLIKSEL